jgi:chromosome segregation ATPase
MPQKRQSLASAAKEAKRSKIDPTVDLTLHDAKSSRPWVDSLLMADAMLVRVEKLELMLQKSNADLEHFKKITEFLNMQMTLSHKTASAIFSLEKELSDKDNQIKTLKDSIKDLKQNHSQTVREHEASILKLQQKISNLIFGDVDSLVIANTELKESNTALLKKISEYQQEKTTFVTQKEELSRAIYTSNQEKASVSADLREASTLLDNMRSQLSKAIQSNQMLFKAVSDTQKELSDISKKNTELALQSILDTQKIKDLNAAVEGKNEVITIMQCIQKSSQTNSENQPQLYSDSPMLRFNPVVRLNERFFSQSMQMPEQTEFDSDSEKHSWFPNGFLRNQ